MGANSKGDSSFHFPLCPWSVLSPCVTPRQLLSAKRAYQRVQEEEDILSVCCVLVLYSIHQLCWWCGACRVYSFKVTWSAPYGTRTLPAVPDPVTCPSCPSLSIPPRPYACPASPPPQCFTTCPPVARARGRDARAPRAARENIKLKREAGLRGILQAMSRWLRPTVSQAWDRWGRPPPR